MERFDLRERIERETGRVPHMSRDGERVEGLFIKRVHAAEQSFALIVQEQTATLAPWRPWMDRALGQFVSGQVKGLEFDFDFGKGLEPKRNLAKSHGLER